MDFRGAPARVSALFEAARRFCAGIYLVERSIYGRPNDEDARGAYS